MMVNIRMNDNSSFVVVPATNAMTVAVTRSLLECKSSLQPTRDGGVLIHCHNV